MAKEGEYKLLKLNLNLKGFDYSKMENEINNLDAEGWEVVEVFAPNYWVRQSIEVLVVIKRLK